MRRMPRFVNARWNSPALSKPNGKARKTIAAPGITNPTLRKRLEQIADEWRAHTAVIEHVSRVRTPHTIMSTSTLKMKRREVHEPRNLWSPVIAPLLTVALLLLVIGTSLFGRGFA
jgi:hypothetical protein